MSTKILERTSGPAALRSAAQLGLPATAESASGMPFVSGRFAVFDSWTLIASPIEGTFLESIDRGAFTRTIKEDRANMRLLFQHGADALIGMRPIAPIDVLGVDGIGGFYAGRLFDTIAGRELAPLLEAGVLGSSFRFRVVQERFDDRPIRSDRNPDRMPERTLLGVTLLELGPCTFPAYQATTAGLSSGEHPPRSALPRERQFKSDEAWLAWLHDAERQAWLDTIMPIPR